MKKIFLTLFFFTTLVLPIQVLGQIDSGLLENIKKSGDVLNKKTSTEIQDKTINTTVGSILGYILSFAGVIFLILMIIASFIWITAQGDKQKITSAKKLLVSGVVGAFISFGSFIIVNTILNPLSERYFSSVNLTSGGSNVTLSQISCSSDIQCADQPTRRLCQDNNCVECRENDVTQSDFTAISSACVDYYGDAKMVCDIANFVCVPNINETCKTLSINACLLREDCRWQYSPAKETWVGAGTNAGIAAVGENTLNWLGVNTNQELGGSCLNKSDYKCNEQCGVDKPFCLTDFSPSRCVECRTDADCEHNLLDKKCSNQSGNYVCTIFNF